jgi:hypothetical protein
MVARDGIEPPTPAFSGPRSTTELPGLSEDFSLHFPARDSGGRRKGRPSSTDSALQQLCQYINSSPTRQASMHLLDRPHKWTAGAELRARNKLNQANSDGLWSGLVCGTV